jgi:hypothetical protein
MFIDESVIDKLLNNFQSFNLTIVMADRIIKDIWYI